MKNNWGTPIKFVANEWLYIGALLLHLILVFSVVFSEPVPIVTDFNHWLFDSYNSIGFKWQSNNGSSLIATGMLSAIFVNILRRITECVLLGWPRFKTNDIATLKTFILRALGYGLLCFLGLGAWGANEAERYAKLTNIVEYSANLNVFHITVISIGTFLIGCIVNVLDDVISALVIFIFKRP